MSKQYFVLLIFFYMLPIKLWAQLNGTYTIPGSYATISAAIAALNGPSGISGSVTFNIAAGHTELASLNNLTINSVIGASSSNTIVFQKSGSGANPLITAGAGVSTSASNGDAIIILNGSDYVTIDGIDVQENSANTTNTLRMEYGFYLKNSSSTDGATNNVIKNCYVTLNRVNTNSKGIYVFQATQATNSSGTNSYNKFYSNNISNCFIGINLNASTIISADNLQDQYNEIGGTSSSTGNTIQNFGSSSSASPARGIDCYGQDFLNIRHNIINNDPGNSTPHNGTLWGVFNISYSAAWISSDVNISNNTIQLRSMAASSQISAIGTSAISGITVVSNNTIQNCTSSNSASTNDFYGLICNTSGTSLTSTVASLTIQNNAIINNTFFSNSASNGWAGIYTNNATGAISISDNLISGNITSGAVTNWYGVRCNNSSGSYNISSNVISNNSCGTNSNRWYGFACDAASSGITISNNTQSNNSSGSSGSSNWYFINANVNSGSACPSVSISSNTISSFTKTGTSTGYLYGINDNGGSNTNSSIVSNSISTIQVGPSTVGWLGINTSSSGTKTISNNTISTISGGNITSSGAASLITTSNGSNTAISGNTLSGMSLSGTTTAFIALGIDVALGTNTIANVYSNSISAITHTSSINGIRINATSGNISIYQNTINSLSSTTAASASTVAGIALSASGTSTSVYRNKIYDLSVNSNTTAFVDGIAYPSTVITGTHSIYNNILGDFRAANGVSSTSVVGLFLDANNAAVTFNVYFNSIYLNSTVGGATFGSACVYARTTPTVNLINNILINKSTSFGTGATIAYKRNNSTTTTYGTTSNYNVFYALGAGTNNYIFYDNTTSFANAQLVNFRAYLDPSTREDNSLVQDVTFVSTTPSNTGFLHIDQTSCSVTLQGIAISGYTVDYDNDTRTVPTIGADETGKATWTGATSTDWSIASNWANGLVPTKYYDVTIPAGVTNFPIISSTTAICHSININASASLNMQSNGKLTLDATCSSSIFTNSGTFTEGTGTEEILFDKGATSNTASVVGKVRFNVVSTNTGLSFDQGANIDSVKSKFRIDNGGYVPTGKAPIYLSTSTLEYNTGLTYGVGEEWYQNTSGTVAGVPQNVTITNNTTLSFGTTTYYHLLRGNLNINSGSQLALSTSGTGGGDIKIGGNWTRSSTGFFSPNGKAVFFIGAASQTITVTGNGTESFDYVVNDNSSAGGIQLSSGTNIYISTISGDNGLQLLGAGPFDLNGQTCTLGNGSFGSIQVTGGVRNITSTGGAAIFVIEGSSVPTPVVYSSDGTSTLVFSSAIRVELNSGFDFGDKLTTINGTLRMNNSSFVKDNAPTYGTGSLLQYYTNSNPFNRTVEWGATSGPGYPYNVQLSNFTILSPGGSNNSDTALNLENNLTIDAGSALYMNYGGNNMTQPLVVGNDLVLNGDLSLSDAFNGDVKVGGNWTRNSTTSNFYPNERAAFFTGSSATPQSVTVAPSGTETFDYLIIDNSGSGVSLSSTDAHVDDLLTLSNGIVTTGSNEIYIMNNAGNAITGYQTDPAAGAVYLNSSYISGRLRRDVVAGSNYVFPVGIATSYQYDSISLTTFSGASNILCFYTAGNFSGATQCSDPATQSPAVTVLGTPITNLLLGGYWTMTPDVTPSAAIYDISLQESAPFLGVATDDSSYAIIKRPDCTADWIDEGFHDDATQQSYPNVTTPDVVKAFRSSVTSFSDFGIGYNSFFLLPVELTNFTVSITEGISVLEWSTASEYNSHYFSIESSEDAIHFKEIGRMNAAGFSTVTQHYLYNDVSAGTSSAARIYYRLRMVDTDNSFQYSAVRWVDLNESTVNESLNIFPNPVQDLLSVTLYSSTEQSATIELTEVTGKLIRKENRPLQQGNNFLEIDRLDELADGIYLLKVTAGRNFYSGKVVKE